MIKHFILIIIILILCGCSRKAGSEVDIKDISKRNGIYYKNGTSTPFSGVCFSYHEDGNVSKKVSIKNGLVHGEFIVYHPNGRVRSRYSYRDGLEDGLCVDYNELGVRITAATFVQGEKNGQAKVWWPNGVLKDLLTFKDGIAHGPHYSWWPNGNLKLWFNQRDGKMDGMMYSFYETGQEQMKLRFNSDSVQFPVTHWKTDGARQLLGEEDEVKDLLSTVFQARNPKSED